MPCVASSFVCLLTRSAGDGGIDGLVAQFISPACRISVGAKSAEDFEDDADIMRPPAVDADAEDDEQTRAQTSAEDARGIEPALNLPDDALFIGYSATHCLLNEE